MFRLFAALGLALIVAACQSDGPRDSGGTPISIDKVSDKGLADALIWLPAPIIRDSILYKLELRNNEHPIETVFTGTGGGYYNAQILRGFYSLFSKETVRQIYDEDEFVDWAKQNDATDGDLSGRVKFGSSYSNNGGWYAEFDEAEFSCILGRVGAGFGPRASAGAGHGLPFNVIIRVRYCGDEEDVRAVRDFLILPKQVKDREAFRQYVAELRDG
ncbi:MAG: hypothetical protein JJ878_01700 [Alphaproteobacteria bacterium]|nr:hypothetical protein [Alphaproteobacteria bacterium]MBO6861322.1 hypothetical protein [Alphaproteobacteria bacterium]